MQMLKMPEDMTNLVIGEDTFTADDSGFISVPNSFVDQAKMFGCTDPAEGVVVEPIASEFDPTITRTNRDLLEANAQHVEDAKQHAVDIDAANEEIARLEKATKGDAEEIANLHSIINSLTSHVEALGKALTDAGGDPEAVITALREEATPAPEGTTAPADVVAAEENTSEGEEGTLEALPDDMPAFSDHDMFKRDDLVKWLKGRGVTVSVSISRANAETAAIETYTEQKAAQDAKAS